jgi:hypothetical protein
MKADAFDIRTFVREAAENDYAVPEELDPKELIPELANLLGAPDQMDRERSYEIIEMWSIRGHFSDETLCTLGDRLAENLGHGLGESETDSVFARSYAALSLCGPVAADELWADGALAGRGAYISHERLRSWLRCAIESLQGENDLRSFIDGKGWADAISHMGDLLQQFARNPHTDVQDLELILNAVADCLNRTSSKVFVHDEGGRLMRAVYSALLRDVLPLETVTSWIERFAQTDDGREWGFGSLFTLESCDHPAVNVRANVREALRDLYFTLKFGPRRGQSEDEIIQRYFAYHDRPVPHCQEVLEALERVLRKLYGGLYPQA